MTARTREEQARIDCLLVENYEHLFDPLTRSAHVAVYTYAQATQDDGWPTPKLIERFAKLYGVPSAPLGAFFGLLSYRGPRRRIWLDAFRGPVPPLGVVPYLAREQSIAYGWMCAMMAEIRRQPKADDEYGGDDDAPASDTLH